MLGSALVLVLVGGTGPNWETGPAGTGSLLLELQICLSLHGCREEEEEEEPAQWGESRLENLDWSSCFPAGDQNKPRGECLVETALLYWNLIRLVYEGRDQKKSFSFSLE